MKQSTPTKKEELVVAGLSVDQMRLDGLALMEDHWREIATNKDLPLEPDWDAYYHLEKMGKLLSLGAWAGSELVGYFVGIYVPKGLHYQAWSYVQNDIFYVAPPYRGKMVAGRLIRTARLLSTAKGMTCIIWHCKPGTEMDVMLSRSDRYSLKEHVYYQELN